MFRSLAGNICRGSAVNSSRNVLRLISPQFSTTAARRCHEQNPTEDHDQGLETKSAVRQVNFLKQDTGILIGSKGSGRIFLEMCTGCTFEIEESDTDEYSTYKITGPNDQSIQKMVTMMNTIVQVSKGEPRDNEVLEYMTTRPQEMGRLLIGKEGKTKRMIELISGCHFTVLNQEIPNNVRITGSPENVEYAKELMTRIINNTPRTSPDSEVIKVTKSDIAQIVGRGGSRIKYIKMISNCGIVTDAEEGVVLVTGSPEARKLGTELIQAIVEFSYESN